MAEKKNYLDCVFSKKAPYDVRVPSLKAEELSRVRGGGWHMDKTGQVTILVENTGYMNRILQKLKKKPRISQLHLEENGSFIWPLIDGERSVHEIGQLVSEQFGEKAEPLYPRLVQYLQQLQKMDLIG
ncbi:MAG: PqqD family protein [Lachnospiraceae bacterium]|nr:PqqD family protein [Lachnospiraceae bacterium]